MKRTNLILALVLSALTLRAQPVYTLQDLLEIGLEQNYSVRIVRNNQQISENNTTLANAGFLPTVNFSGGVAGNLNDTRTTSVDGVTARDNGILNQNANAGINANWPIFDGFRIQANYRRLQELQALGEINTRVTMEDFIASLAARYYNLIQQKIRLDNLAYVMSLSAERLRIADVRRDIGSGSRLNLLQAQVDFNADSSRYVNQLTAVRESMIRLNELLANRDVEAHIGVVDSLIPVNDGLRIDELEENMRRVNASLLAAERNTYIAEQDLEILKSRNYPFVSMNTGYGYTWNSYGSGNTSTRNNLGFNVGVTVGMTIFNGNRQREQANARIVIENNRLRQQQLEESLRANLLNFWQAYRNNLEIYRMERENVRVARENYAIAMERFYDIGNLSGYEMREAQRSLFDAEERLLMSTFNTKMCEISLMQISGRILEYLD